MIYEGQNETFAAHYDSSSFMAVIIMSCSEQTHAVIYFGLGQQTVFQKIWSHNGDE